MASDLMITHVEFRSDNFPPIENEEEIVNPDLWGKRLADAIWKGLRERGIQASSPIPEDWGWVVRIADSPFPLWIGCGHYQDYPDGYLCFIEPHKPFVWKFFRKFDTRPRVAALQSAIDSILSEDAGIRAKRWVTFEEFNNPAG